MTFLLFVAVVVLLVWCARLSARIDSLERTHGVQREVTKAPLPSLSSNITAPAPSIVTEREQIPVPLTHTAPRTEGSMPLPLQPATPDPLLAWFKENTLIKVGALLFFLGAVWFVSYAISQGWISPLTRIMLGILMGIVVAGVGVARKRANTEQYVTLTLLGSAIAIASVYAGQFLFSLFSPIFALMILVAAVGYTVAVALETRTEWLCVFAAVAGMVAPLLVNAPHPNPTSFLVYLFALSVAFLAVVFFTTWRSVTLTLIIGSTVFLLSTYAQGLLSHGHLGLFVAAFSALFFAEASVSMWRINDPDAADMVSLGIVSLTALYWIYTLATYDGLLAFVCAVICVTFGYAAVVNGRSKHIVAIYAAFAALCAFIATALTFEGYTLTLVYILEVSTAFVLAVRVRLPESVVVTTGWMSAVPILLSFADVASSAWQTGIFHPSAYVLYACVGAFALCCATALRESRLRSDAVLLPAGAIFFALTIFYSYLCIWLIGGAAFEESGALIFRYCGWLMCTIVSLGVILTYRLPFTWIVPALAPLALPLLASFGSVASAQWLESWFHNDMLGLVVMMCGCAVIAMMCMDARRVYTATGEILSTLISLFWLLCGLYAVGLVWLIAHAALASDEIAVSVALFVYTVSGLVLYMLGRQEGNEGVRYAGILLLASVVVRLLIIDVWRMELLWRIVTFLGVGLLFMATALFEKPFEKIVRTSDQ